jgi:hypothetical protein
MKKVFSVLAIAALVLVSLSSCNPNNKSYADYLTQKKGWVLSAATSNPAYEMSDGSFVTNLMTEGYLYDFENDYIITFNQDGTEYVKPGKTVAPDDFTGDAYRAETQIGTWRFDNTLIPTLLYMQVPFFYDDAVETCKLLSLTENELKVSCTINDDDPTAKGTYSFILTYVPAK